MAIFHFSLNSFLPLAILLVRSVQQTVIPLPLFHQIFCTTKKKKAPSSTVIKFGKNPARCPHYLADQCHLFAALKWCIRLAQLRLIWINSHCSVRNCAHKRQCRYVENCYILLSSQTDHLLSCILLWHWRRFLIIHNSIRNEFHSNDLAMLNANAISHSY